MTRTSSICQKAPSAKRCIKTQFLKSMNCHKALDTSESTERQKVH